MGLFFDLPFVMGKAKYSKVADNPEKAVRAQGSYLRVHFKNTYEAAMSIKGMDLRKAQRYLNDVIEKKQAIAFRRFNGGPGRHAQGKNLKAPGGQVRWPQKSCKFLLDLLQNAEGSATKKELAPESMVVTHIQVNRAPKQRRRSYRAHGRINPYLSSPSHIEMILTEQDVPVPRPKAAKSKTAKLAQ